MRPLLSDAELFLRLSSGVQPSAVAVQITRRAMRSFGGWREFLKAPPKDLPGVDPQRLRWLEELAQRLASARPYAFTSSVCAAETLRGLLPEDQEGIAAAFLHADHSLIQARLIFRGAVSECFAQPREILRAALQSGAAYVVVAHNHVGGEPAPSESDVRFTARLEWAAKLVGIPLLDHLVLAEHGAFFSFADAGLMKKEARPER
ncbi:hypothetical protein K2X33_11195 [bacterium]|nr:hypothetical protein [bacterium]